MSEFPLLSEQEIEQKPVFNSLAEALEDPDNAYVLELMGEVFDPDELAEALEQLPRLQILVIEANGSLDEIPSAIGGLKNLQYLEISGCPLEFVPDELGECLEMTGLVLSNVRPLDTLPESMGNLTKLNFVEISATEIDYLPDTFAGWTSVEELNLINNRLHELPSAIGEMSALTTLRTYGNYAMYVDDFILNLRHLTTFDHGLIQFRGTTGEEVRAALPGLVMTQVTDNDPVFKG